MLGVGSKLVQMGVKPSAETSNERPATRGKAKTIVCTLDKPVIILCNDGIGHSHKLGRKSTETIRYASGRKARVTHQALDDEPPRPVLGRQFPASDRGKPILLHPPGII